MNLLARSSGVAVYEQGSELWVVPQPTSWRYTAVFVLGIITLITGVNGAIFCLSGRFAFGAPIAGAALIGGLLIYALVSQIRSRHRRVPEERDAAVILDFAGRRLLDPGRRPLADLAAVRLGRRFQFGSSAPALEISWPGGSRILVRGNAFAGGIADVEEVLQSKLSELPPAVGQ
jgi:hypothetical protein